ncbi:replication A protein [Escherichia coli KTE233]|nr:replication A protein [Escherichia coli KTE233]
MPDNVDFIQEQQNILTGAVLRDISRNTSQKTSTAMHWMVSSIMIPAGR